MKLHASHLKLHREKDILNSVSLEVSAGEMILILGPSGAGKSTFLRCLNRLDAVDSGEIHVDGEDASSLPITELRRRVGMVFQTPALLPDTVWANLQLGPSLRDETLEVDRCRELLQQVGLPRQFLKREVETLSAGEKQRVALAQTLANEPDVLLLDEPTSALDPTAVRTVEKLIRKIHAEMGITILWVTHDLHQAVRLDTQTVVMVEGRIVARGNIRKLMQDVNNVTLKRFFAGRLKGGQAPVEEKEGESHEH